MSRGIALIAALTVTAGQQEVPAGDVVAGRDGLLANCRFHTVMRRAWFRKTTYEATA
jgi:hypothetical protein